VIELSKNDHLIGEQYFDLSRKSTDGLGYQINVPFHDHNRQIAAQDEFYLNHRYVSLHNFKNNDEHCHYHGVVDSDEKFLAAISIVNSNQLSGFFQSESKSHYLIADQKIQTTILINVDSNREFPQRESLQYCLDHSEDQASSQTYTSRNPHRAKRSSVSSGAVGGKMSLRRKKKSSLENRVIHGPYERNSESLFVELLMVHDHSQCKEYGGNETLIAERTMQIVNIMNAFYRQINIFVALVGIILWTNEDEIKLIEDGDSTLTNFLKYRKEKLLPRYRHDSAQLITSTSFNGNVVGKALKGSICTHDHSGGVNTDHSHSPVIVAVTLAHELGHNLGMEHDEEEKCTCPDKECIMSSSSSSFHPKLWSSCSLNYLEDSRKHGLLECLRNVPEQILGPVCGNGFVEEGEDCDIGEPLPSRGTSVSKSRIDRTIDRGSGHDSSRWSNPCCDRVTCKFVANATCAQGSCCDLSRCAVFNSTEAKVCRPKKTECDFEEICDGVSEYCPADVYHHDGLQCGPTVSLAASLEDQSLVETGSILYNRSRSHCYQGRCASHESQCQLLWGSAGTTSRDICYEQNVHGNTSGNCGYNRKENTYESCEPDNALCGMLHCVHNQPSSGDTTRKMGKLSYGFESASVLTVSFFVMSNHDRIYCHGAIIDAGPEMRDPGLVPNGASCGYDRMCLNQKCIPVASVLSENWCPSDCNGNGICDNKGVCHCNDGTIGTSCYQFFSSNFHLSLMIYIMMFFGPIVAIVVLAANHYRKRIKIWWFLHNRMVALRNKAREPNHKSSMQARRAMAYQAKGHQVTISEPIPLNQRADKFQAEIFNANATNADPWAETSVSSAQQPPTAALISALTTPTHIPSGSGSGAAFYKPPGYTMQPLAKKPLEPLPPPLPPHRQQVSTDLQPAPHGGAPVKLRPGKYHKKVSSHFQEIRCSDRGYQF